MFDKQLSRAGREKPAFFAFFHQNLLFSGILIIIELSVNTIGPQSRGPALGEGL